MLQNAHSLHISLSSPTTCINKSAIAKRFQGKTLRGLVVRMRSANTTLFSRFPSFSPPLADCLSLYSVLGTQKKQGHWINLKPSVFSQSLHVVRLRGYTAWVSHTWDTTAMKNIKEIIWCSSGSTRQWVFCVIMPSLHQSERWLWRIPWDCWIYLYVL